MRLINLNIFSLLQNNRNKINININNKLYSTYTHLKKLKDNKYLKLAKNNRKNNKILNIQIKYDNTVLNIYINKNQKIANIIGNH